MQSVLRSLDTLEAISRMQPIRLSELSRAVGLPKTTVARIVRTLGEAGWIAADSSRGDPRWSLTPRALAVGATVSQVDLREVARPALEEIGAATDENIHLSAPDEDTMVLIERVASSRSVQTVANIGDRVPMHLTASGWAYLSCLSDAEAQAVLPDVLVPTTDRSVVDREELLGDLVTVRERGYAVNPGRWRSDVAAIGAAVVNGAGHPIAAISISMPSYRFNDDLAAPYGELVREATARVSRDMARLSGVGVRIPTRPR
ncbi:MAG: IclR family transcriptional regulator [Tetrasphaera sp.]